MRVVGSTEIRVISPIDTTNEGPIVPKGKKGWQPVHLRQGSMDGACGLYSLMMGLIICGVVPYDKACSFSGFSSKSRLGILFNQLANSSVLYKQGTSPVAMLQAINDHFSEDVNFQPSQGSDLVEFINRHVIDNHSVLLALAFEGGAHWVLVIGRECERQGKETELCRFLILDPSKDVSQICSWNGVIDGRKLKGEYPYNWWTLNRKVQLAYGIAIWPKKENKQ